jgi:Spy/CpxP family protein refolding chaperone
VVSSAGAPSAGLEPEEHHHMTTKVRKLTATVSAAALLGAGGVGAAQAASGTADRPAGPRGGHHALSTTQLQAIASKLGVTTAQLQAAIEANQPARSERPARGAKPGKPDSGKLVTALATGLDLDEATVKAALAKLEAERKTAHETQEDARYAAIATE